MPSNNDKTGVTFQVAFNFGNFFTVYITNVSGYLRHFLLDNFLLRTLVLMVGRYPKPFVRGIYSFNGKCERKKGEYVSNYHFRVV